MCLHGSNNVYPPYIFSTSDYLNSPQYFHCLFHSDRRLVLRTRANKASRLLWCQGNTSRGYVEDFVNKSVPLLHILHPLHVSSTTSSYHVCLAQTRSIPTKRVVTPSPVPQQAPNTRSTNTLTVTTTLNTFFDPFFLSHPTYLRSITNTQFTLNTQPKQTQPETTPDPYLTTNPHHLTTPTQHIPHTPLSPTPSPAHSPIPPPSFHHHFSR